MNAGAAFHVQPFQELLESLYAQPYARRHNFSQLSLEEIEQHLSTHNGELELPQSFSICRETFILLLHSLELQGIADFPQLGAPSTEMPTTVAAKSLSEQYHRIAEYFLGSEDLPFSEPHRLRLVIENLCFSVEAEGQKRISENLRAFWANRDYEIQRLFEPDSGELSPQALYAVQSFIQGNNHFLYEGRFPFAMITNTLTYLRDINSEEPLEPSALEIAALLLFFGQSFDFDDFSLHNVLYADGLEPAEIVELCFRLLRIHKHKNRVLTTGFLPTAQLLLVVQEDCQRALDLFSKLSFLDAGQLQSVA